MKVEIDIDMSKIDYDSINTQIKEKLDSLTPSDIFKRYYKTDDDISRYIEKRLDEGSESYMVNQGWWSNDNAKQNIRNIAERIVDENVPLLEVNGESNGIFAKLMKIFKKN